MNSKKHFLLLTILTISTSCIFTKGWFSNPEEEAFQKMQKDLIRIQLEKETIELELKRRKLKEIVEQEAEKAAIELKTHLEETTRIQAHEKRSQRILNAYDALHQPVPTSIKQRANHSFLDLTDISSPDAANKIAWAPYAPTTIGICAQTALEIVGKPSFAKVVGTLSDDISTKLATKILKKTNLMPRSTSKIQEFLESIENPTEEDQEMINIILALNKKLPNNQLPELLLELMKLHHQNEILRQKYREEKEAAIRAYEASHRNEHPVEELSDGN